MEKVISPELENFLRLCHSRQQLGLPSGTLRFRRTRSLQRTSEWTVVTAGRRWGSSRKRVFAKHYANGQDADLENEFRALSLLRHEWRNRTEFGVPTPLVCDPGRRCIAMEHCDGVPMPRLLLRWLVLGPLAPQDGLRAVRVAGSMLAALQRVPAGQGADESWRMLAESRYQHALTRRLERGRIARLPASLLSDAERIIDIPRIVSSARMVTQHSDFAPWNIIIERQYCATLVDLHNLTIGVPEYDLAYFCTALELYRRFRVVRNRAVAALQSAFLQAYQEDADPELLAAGPIRELDAPRFAPFDVLCVMHAIYFCSALLGTPSAPGPYRRRPVDNRRFVIRWLEDLLARCD